VPVQELDVVVEILVEVAAADGLALRSGLVELEKK